MIVARHFRFAIQAFSIFGPARHFRADLPIFAPLAHNFCLNLENFVTGARQFLCDLTNFESVACHSGFDLAIFMPVAHQFFQTF